MSMEIAVALLEQISVDSTVPKNIRKITQDVVGRLKDESKSVSVRVNTVVSILDEISSDPNLPIHTRTTVWEVASNLETVSKKAK